MQKLTRALSALLVPVVLLGYTADSNAQATDLDCVKCVDAKDLSPAAVTTYKLKNKAVSTAKIKDGAVTKEKLAAGAVGASQVNDVQVQLRVTGSCESGRFVTVVKKNGTVKCESGGDADGNTRYGENVLAYNTTGVRNTAVGEVALFLNETGINNSAFGFAALNATTSGHRNVAIGAFALVENTIGHRNIAVGMGAMAHNTDGSYNTAVGSGGTLADNTSGTQNTGIGALALHMNSTGSQNSAMGTESLALNTIGSYNTGIGYLALSQNVEGEGNIAVGTYAGENITGSHNIAIGNGGVDGESGTIRIGGPSQTRTFVSGIRGTTTGIADAVTVVIDSNGQLGTVSSSRRYKENINDMGDASDRLLSLHPVTFQYGQAYANGEKPVQFGLIAEEVAEVFPELVVFNENNQPETVKYRLLSSLLLNELQKQQATLNGQVADIAELRSQVAELGLLVEELAAGR